jgi:molybdate transport system ATP-binding protein
MRANSAEDGTPPEGITHSNGTRWSDGISHGLQAADRGEAAEREAANRTDGPPAAPSYASLGLHVEAERRLPGFTLRAAFSVPPGLTVLFGPSGAGKSLTLQAIAGLVPLHRGRIELDGRMLADTAGGVALSPQRRQLGYVPQQYALFPHMTVAENVAYALPRPRHPWDRSAAAQRAERVAELLALVRLTGFEARRPRELSGGQAQRVALARALAAQPQALLLDEPLGALDAPTRAAVQDDLRAVVLESGVPAIVVTHDLSEARALGDRLVVLINGRVIAEGPVADVLASPPTAEAALLLGWRNVLPIARLTWTTAGARAEIESGQVLHVPHIAVAIDLVGTHPFEPASQARQGTPAALALHADRLEIAGAAADGLDGLAVERETEAVGAERRQTLRGTLLGVGDAGAYCSLRVALAGRTPDGQPSPLITVTCSPREWAALGVVPGDPVALHVDAAALRLVAADARGRQERNQEDSDEHTAPAVTSH